MILARSPFLRWYHPDRLQLGLNSLHPFGFGYPFTSGGSDTTVMPDARLAKIRTLFDFKRMAVDPEALLTADGGSNVTTTQLDARIAEIVAGVARRVAAGLKVIVDVHFHGSLVSISSGWQYDSVFDGGTKATRFGFVLARLAAALAAYGKSGWVCLEIFNEPPYPALVSTAAFIAQQRVWWAQVRAAMPLHTIVVASNALNALDGTPAGDGTSGLTALTPSHYDINTAFAYHPYEAGVFTHQGVLGSIYQYMHGLVYPATSHPGGQAAAEAAFLAAAAAEGDHDGVLAADAINAVVTQTTWSSSLAKYFTQYGTKALLNIRQGVVTTWAAAAGISNKRIMLSETGVNFAHASNDASGASAEAFIRDLRQNAEAAGLNCLVIHEEQGSNFGIQATSSPWAFDPNVEAALAA